MWFIYSTMVVSSHRNTISFFILFNTNSTEYICIGHWLVFFSFLSWKWKRTDWILVLHSLAFCLDGRGKSLVWTSAFAILVFRSELVILLGLILLQEVFLKRRLNFITALTHGLIASGLAVGKMHQSHDSTIVFLFSSSLC